MRRGWLPILSEGDFRVLGALGSFMAGGSDIAWPGVGKLQELTGLSRSGLYEVLDRLQSYRLISSETVSRSGRYGPHHVTAYRLAREVPPAPTVRTSGESQEKRTLSARADGQSPEADGLVRRRGQSVGGNADGAALSASVYGHIPENEYKTVASFPHTQAREKLAKQLDGQDLPEKLGAFLVDFLASGGTLDRNVVKGLTAIGKRMGWTEAHIWRAAAVLQSEVGTSQVKASALDPMVEKALELSGGEIVEVKRLDA